MEWRKAGLVAMVGMLLMAAFAESAGAGAGADEVIQLVSDGVNEHPEKMTGRLRCPRILMECETTSDCLPGCTCRPNGFCG